MNRPRPHRDAHSIYSESPPAFSTLLQGIGQLFEKIKQESKANGHPNGDAGLFFTNLYVTPVLRNISLYLEKGQMLAVAGSTGSGKVGQRKPLIHRRVYYRDFTTAAESSFHFLPELPAHDDPW